MLTREDIESKLKKHPLVEPRLQTLRLAEEINPDFKTPHIVGGFLRNIILDVPPNDCDVVFKGNKLNQQGILESIRLAEEKLGIDPFPDWEFENISATGISGDLYEDVVGQYAHHTDYLTMLIIGSSGKVTIGEEQKTLKDLSERVYDLRFAGVEIWANHRGNGRTYASCLTGDLTRGLYLSVSLSLNQSLIVSFLMERYDLIFNSLNKDDQEARKAYWLKKTKGDQKYQTILDKFNISALN